MSEAYLVSGEAEGRLFWGTRPRGSLRAAASTTGSGREFISRRVTPLCNLLSGSRPYLKRTVLGGESVACPLTDKEIGIPEFPDQGEPPGALVQVLWT